MESAVGKGTTVNVLLSFKLPEGVSIPAEQGSWQSPQAGRSLRILLAEDEPSNAMPIMKLLERCWRRTFVRNNMLPQDHKAIDSAHVFFALTSDNVFSRYKYHALKNVAVVIGNLTI